MKRASMHNESTRDFAIDIRVTPQISFLSASKFFYIHRASETVPGGAFTRHSAEQAIGIGRWPGLARI